MINSITYLTTSTVLLPKAVQPTRTLRTSNQCCDDGRPCITPGSTATSSCDETPGKCKPVCARDVTHRKSHNLSDCGCSTLLVEVTRATTQSNKFGSRTVGTRFIGGLDNVATTGIRGNCNVLANRNTRRRCNVKRHTCRHGQSLFSRTTISNKAVTCRSSNRTHTARSNRGFRGNFGRTSKNELVNGIDTPAGPTSSNGNGSFRGGPSALCFRGIRGPSNADGIPNAGTCSVTGGCRGFITGSTAVTNTRGAVNSGISIGQTSRSLLSRVFARRFLTGLRGNRCG